MRSAVAAIRARRLSHSARRSREAVQLVQGVGYSGELSSEDFAPLDQDPSRMRIGDVLYRRPVTKPLAALTWAAALERANKTEERVVGALEIVPDLRKKRLIELYAPTGVGELSSRHGGDQAEFGLGLGEHDHDLDPAGRQRRI